MAASAPRRRRPKRRGYERPSRAAPKAGWSLRQLAQVSGVAVRTLRRYMERGVLPRPPFRGAATRYERRQVLWLCATRHLFAAEGLTLAAVRTRLNALSAPELEAFAVQHTPPGKLADALGLRAAAPSAAQPSPPQAYPALAAVPTQGASDASAPHVARWKRIELALGLELHVREDASLDVQELARHGQRGRAGAGGAL